jgi:hypothetical protein
MSECDPAFVFHVLQLIDSSQRGMLIQKVAIILEQVYNPGFYRLQWRFLVNIPHIGAFLKK